MRWQNVLRETTTTRTGNIPDADVTGVAYDSRRVLPGDIFVAMRGGAVDGNRFLDQALAAGAAAILTDAPEAFRTLTDRVPCALVDHGRRALAQASAAVFHHPERDLKLTAVTGTNGKTTTAFLTESLLLAADRKTLLIGTIETHLPATDGTRETRETQHTTPESRDLYALFREAADRGATEAVMEMSSHALDQERVFGLPVDVAIFTNLTQDHLDYHGTMEAYGAAKARLFQGIGAPPPRVSILNADDPAFPTMDTAAALLRHPLDLQPPRPHGRLPRRSHPLPRRPNRLSPQHALRQRGSHHRPHRPRQRLQPARRRRRRTRTRPQLRRPHARHPRPPPRPRPL